MDILKAWKLVEENEDLRRERDELRVRVEQLEVALAEDAGEDADGRVWN
jgi:regulator of replication initiation timing